MLPGIPSDYGGSEDSKSPSIEEMKANVDLMSRLMAESVKDLEKGYSFSHCNYGVFKSIYIQWSCIFKCSKYCCLSVFVVLWHVVCQFLITILAMNYKNLRL